MQRTDFSPTGVMYKNLPVSSGYGYDRIEAISRYLRERCQIAPQVGIICGTGLGGLADQLTDKQSFPYDSIPDFPLSTVVGHSGSLIFGYLNEVPVVCMKGRFHPYEGYPMWKCSMPVRVMKLLGVKALIVTNAAGGLNAKYAVGDIMIIKDHINMPGLAGDSPLKGKNDERWGPRFPPMTKAYDPDLVRRAHKHAVDLGMAEYIRDGCYAMVGGPTFETVSEARLLRTLGGDAVGMSTVHEVIVARHCGLRVIGFSLITNKCIDDFDDNNAANHEEVLEIGAKRAEDMVRLVQAVLPDLLN